MKLFERLLNNSISAPTLNIFLIENINEVIDFQNKNFCELKNEAELISKFITDKGTILKTLDYKESHNKAFISILFDLCERFGFINTVRISSIVSENNIIVSHRLLAAKLYLLNIASNTDLINRFDEICFNLQFALENEEDNIKKIDLTFANYINYVLNNTSDKIIFTLFQKINEAVLIKKYNFLSSEFIQQIITLNDFNNNRLIELNTLIESYINKIPTLLKNVPGYLLEEDTDYCIQIERSNPNFNSIRSISITGLNRLSETQKQNIYADLLRGVKPLENENELFAYMVFFGLMHHKKLTSAHAYLPDEIFNYELNIIDWGCGQGMASISFLELINLKAAKTKINNITLIEPSELALKRASLHVSKFNNANNIQTINKYLDSLSIVDFVNNESIAKLHLFSNILDIDLFSLTDLIKLISKSFIGINYFICVSPFIDDLKTSRLDTFMHSFSKNDNFQIIKSINNKKGQWEDLKWSRVLRIFKVTI